jgi:hypothetical protein
MTDHPYSRIRLYDHPDKRACLAAALAAQVIAVQAQDEAVAAHNVAYLASISAERRLEDLAEAEEAAGVDLAKKIKMDVAEGRIAEVKLGRADPTDRARAMTEVSQTQAALRMLKGELDSAKEVAAQAAEDVQARIRDVMASQIPAMRAEAEAAVETLKRIRWSLLGLSKASYFQTASGLRSLPFSHDLQQLIQWNFTSGDERRPISDRADDVAPWRAFREALATDAFASAPIRDEG